MYLLKMAKNEQYYFQVETPQIGANKSQLFTNIINESINCLFIQSQCPEINSNKVSNTI